MSFLEVMWVLFIPIFLIGWAVIRSGLTISNIFFGLGSFTAVVTILYVVTEGDIPSWMKVILLFFISSVAIGIGYYISRGDESEEGSKGVISETKEDTDEG
ncbi:MAG: hypothetical protein SVJ22_09620 [Halobacteriota archaeon]|nr:hypothetical protein [Halobacteriota archaeon]MDY6932157.1 hypothetical protein [Halobacteriota archaeon]